MPEPIHCYPRAEWSALVEMPEAVSVMVDRTAVDADSDRHRVALPALVPIDYRTLVAASGR